MSKKVGFAVITAVLAVLILVGALRMQDNGSFETTFFAMNTFINAKITGKDSDETGEQILNAVKEFEQSNSMYLEDSFVSKINSNAGKSYVPVDEETYALIKRACNLCEQSGGKFDITIGPLVKKWNVTADRPHIPEIDENIMSLINYQDILFNDEDTSIMLKNQGQIIDLGGIAKGSISDKVYGILEQSKVKEAAISIGGNVIVYGNDSYKVGVQHPRREGELIATLRLKNQIISTTGDYQRYFEVNGKRYHHIIDPKTGQPYDSDFYSITVIGGDGTFNDYLSTTLFMTPKQEVISLLDTYSIIAVCKDNTVYASPHLDIELKDDNFTIYKR